MDSQEHKASYQTTQGLLYPGLEQELKIISTKEGDNSNSIMCFGKMGFREALQSNEKG